VKTFPAVLDRVEPRRASRSRTAGSVSDGWEHASRRSLTVPGMGLLNVYVVRLSCPLSTVRDRIGGGKETVGRAVVPRQRNVDLPFSGGR